MHKLKNYLLVLLLFSCASLAQEIVIWHSMGGYLGERFFDIVQQFNQKPQNLKNGITVALRYKGDYDQAMALGLEAAGTLEAPHILQVYEKGHLVMQAQPNVYIPLNKLSHEPSPLLQKERFLTAIQDFYKNRHGEEGLASLPFSVSSVVLFYNKAAFKAAGLDPANPPKTWEEFERVAYLLKKHGAHNVLASTWLSGHHIEHTGSWHNKAVATKGNGLDGKGALLAINTPFFQDHFNKLLSWYQVGIFSLVFGEKAEQAFADQEVLMLTSSANRLSFLQNLIKERFDIGVTTFPYWATVVARPYNTAVNGTSFWAIAGHPADDYRVVEQFFEFLASPEIQNEWHQSTCYLPVIVGVQALAEKQHFYEQGMNGKVAKIAMDSFMQRTPGQFSRGVLLPEFPAVRDRIVQELRGAFKGNQSVEAALEHSVSEVNIMLETVE